MNNLYFKKLASEVKKLANQIEKVSKGQSIIKDLLEEVLDLEDDIRKLITGKYGAIDHDARLKIIWESSTRQKDAIEKSLFTVLDSGEQTTKKIIRDFEKSVLRTIELLSWYHKQHLNEDFHSHGIKAKDLNTRMNELKIIYKKLRIYERKMKI